MKDVVPARVVVPVVVASALELDTELEPLPYHSRDPGIVDGESKLVREPVAGSVQVDPVHV